MTSIAVLSCQFGMHRLVSGYVGATLQFIGAFAGILDGFVRCPGDANRANGRTDTLDAAATGVIFDMFGESSSAKANVGYKLLNFAHRPDA